MSNWKLSDLSTKRRRYAKVINQLPQSKEVILRDSVALIKHETSLIKLFGSLTITIGGRCIPLVLVKR